MRLRTTRDVGAFVRHERRRAGLTQEELARRAGMTRRWLSALETGKSRVDLALVLATFESLCVEVHAGPAEDFQASAGTDNSIDLDEVLSDYDKRTDDP